jgi:hypothetical protein
MSTPLPKTKGDRVDEFVQAAVASIKSAVEHCAAHPDELAVWAAPTLLLAVALRRHRLTWPEQFIVSEAGAMLGELLAEKYTAWKKQPAAPSPNPLKKVA